MLQFLGDSGNVSERKARLFAVACCRRVWGWLTHDKSRRAIEVAERFADAERHPPSGEYLRLQLEMARAWDDAGANWLPVVQDPLRWAREYSTWAATRAVPAAEQPAERRAQADLLRDVFGPWPLCEHPLLAPSLLHWNDNIIPRMANAIYDNRDLPSGHLDPARLAVLADALEDAGCSDAGLLGHLRGGVHVRGCWAVDLLLGRS
jgi:hypothetical protein